MFSKTTTKLHGVSVYIHPIAFGVSFNLSLQSQPHWSLFNNTWQKRRKEPDNRLSFEIVGASLCVLQRTHPATHSHTLQHTATHCNTLQQTATHCNTLQHTDICACYSASRCVSMCLAALLWEYVWLSELTLQTTAAHCNTLQHTATHCNKLQRTGICVWLSELTLQHTATHCNTLQHTATHCNTLQRTGICAWLDELVKISESLSGWVFM